MAGIYIFFCAPAAWNVIFYRVYFTRYNICNCVSTQRKKWEEMWASVCVRSPFAPRTQQRFSVSLVNFPFLSGVYSYSEPVFLYFSHFSHFLYSFTFPLSFSVILCLHLMPWHSQYLRHLIDICFHNRESFVRHGHAISTKIFTRTLLLIPDFWTICALFSQPHRAIVDVVDVAGFCFCCRCRSRQLYTLNNRFLRFLSIIAIKNRHHEDVSASGGKWTNTDATHNHVATRFLVKTHPER